MDTATKKLIGKIQRNEDAELRQRLNRALRALKKYGPRFHKVELTNLENAIEPAIGRVVADQ